MSLTINHGTKTPSESRRRWLVAALALACVSAGAIAVAEDPSKKDTVQPKAGAEPAKKAGTAKKDVKQPQKKKAEQAKKGDEEKKEDAKAEPAVDPANKYVVKTEPFNVDVEAKGTLEAAETSEISVAPE